MLAPFGGLPEGVTEDDVVALNIEHGMVTLTTTVRLPPRYKDIRMLPAFSPHECAAPDEQYISYSGGACGTFALPRNQKTEWMNTGSGWVVRNKPHTFPS